MVGDFEGWPMLPVRKTDAGNKQKTLFFRFLLRQSNFGWLVPAHFNSHGNNSLSKEQLAKLFR